MDAADPINADLRERPAHAAHGRTLTVALSLPQAAALAGADSGDLAAGERGDAAAAGRVLAAFDRYLTERGRRLAQLRAADRAGDRQPISQLEAKISIAGQARAAYAARTR